MPGRFKWCGACEECADCGECAELNADPDSSEQCLESKENECKTRRQCNKPQNTRALFPFDTPDQSRALLQADEFTDRISTLSSIFTGNLVSPFCWGSKCNDIPRVDSSVIQGIISATSTEDCGGILLSTTLDSLTVRQILSVLLGDGIPENLDLLLNFGITRPIELAVEVYGTSKLTLSAKLDSQESPPASFGEKEDILEKILDFIRR